MVVLYIEGGEVAADHQRDQMIVRGFLHVDRIDVQAIAQNRDAVRYDIKLTHAVRNIYNAYAARLQPANCIKQHIDFSFRQRGGRLIHYDDLGTEGNRSYDLHHLSLCNVQVADDLICPDVKVETIQHFLRFRFHPRHIDQAELRLQLAADEDVFRHRHVQREHQLLMDDADAVLAGAFNIADICFLTFNCNRAGVLGVHATKDFDQSRFARTILSQ